MQDDDDLGVGDVCALTGATRRTLQYYDRLGLVPATRDVSGRRRYRAADVARFQYVQVLASLDLPLDRIGELMAGRADDLELLRHQQEVLEKEGLRLRTRSTVVAAIVRALASAPDVRITSGVLPALLGTESALLEHGETDGGGSPETPTGDVSDPAVAFVVEVYLRWKSVSVQALVLVENAVPSESEAGLDVGARWQQYLDLVTGGEIDPAVFEAGRAEADAWPEADQQLLARTEDYVTACHVHYREAGAD